MTFSFSHFHKLTLGLLFSVYSWFFVGELYNVATEKSTCVSAYDGFGYYMYLPFLLNHGSLKMTPEWAQATQNKYCHGTIAYQLSKRENGNYIDIYHMGQSFIEAPAFFLGHLAAIASNAPRDGFSKPYHLAFVCNAWLFVLFGLFYVNKLLRLFFDEKVTAIALLLLYFGTNFWVTATLSYSLQHIYLFAIIAAMGYYFWKAIQTNVFQIRAFRIAVILFGLCTVIRPTHALLGLIPFMLLWNYFPTRKEFWWRMSWFVISSICWNIPQLLYWKLVGGSWVILNLHTEDLVLGDPNILKFLVSFRKGWLIYSPIFLLLIPGFIVLRQRNKLLFRALFFTTCLAIWVFSAWENWWYAASFGARVMVDLYPLLMLPIGFALHSLLKRRVFSILVFGFGFSCLVLALFQSWQFKEGILHNERMTFAQYIYIFGKTSRKNFDDHRLLIDRSDVHWVERVSEHNWNDQHIETKTWFHLNRPFHAKANWDTLIVKLPFFPTFRTDEVQLGIQLEYETDDTENSGSIHFETAGKHNCYGWNSIDLTPANRQLYTSNLFRFNLPDIRHHSDYLQVYVKNPTRGTIHINRLVIKSYRLIRD